MKNEQLILSEMARAGVWTLTLNRPEKRNALTVSLLGRLVEVIRDLESRPDSRIMVLRGAGPAFCSGLDLSEASDSAAAHRSAHVLVDALTRLSESPVLSIAAVHGAAIAGGAGIAAACDFVVSAVDARWSFPEVRRGLVPAFIAAVLSRQTGVRRLSEWLLTGEPVGVTELQGAGVINRAVPQEKLDAEVDKLVDSLLAGGPESQRSTKRALEKLGGPGLRTQLERAFLDHLQARSSGEAAEGIRAFLEKRRPDWGRVSRKR
jgi:methylglutaconyl-CoA hydratase